MIAGEEIGDYRAVTLTFQEKYVKVPLAQLIRDSIERFRKYLPKCGLFILGAELTEKGCLHWHYVINVQDSVKHKIFLGWWRRHCGFIKVIQPKNLVSSIDYAKEEKNQVIKETFGFEFPEINNGNIEELFINTRKPTEGEGKTIMDYI